MNAEEAFVEAVQMAASFLIAELTAVHFQKVTGGFQCMTDAREASSGDVLGERERGHTMEMGCVLAGLMEFALQILLGDEHVAQGHADVCVPEQLHESGQANPQPEHLSGKSVPKPMGRHMARATRAPRRFG